jgi:hypothetical protein
MGETFWRRVHKRAFSETRHALRLESTERVVISVIIAIVGLAVLWNVGGQADTAKSLFTKGAATLAILLLLPCIYLWKFFAAPAAMDAETRDKNEAETTQLRRKLDEQSINAPDLDLSVEGYIVGGVRAEDPAAAPAVLMLSLVNKGGMASVATHWGLKAEYEGKSYNGKLAAPPSIKLGFEDTPSGSTTITYGREDAIFLKSVATPLQTGAMIQGYLLALFYDFDRNAFEKGVSLTVSFCDVLSRRYENLPDPYF